MNDRQIWDLERSLWMADAERYRELIDDECLMVLPAEPYVYSGAQAIEAVADTPRWQEVEFLLGHVARPRDGLIVIAYQAEATREGTGYTAACTSTYRRIGANEWRVVQHQQTPPLRAPAR